MDGITASVEERNKELAGIAEMVLRAMRREVEEKGLRLSITEVELERESTQVSGREVSGLQQTRRSRSCSPHGNTWSGLEIENAAAVGSKQVGEKAEVRCEVPNCQRESRLSEERNK